MISARPTDEGPYQGKFLAAMPGMPDDRFRSTLIYVCKHTDDGAMGLVANKPHSNLNFKGLLSELSMEADSKVTTDDIVLSNRDGTIEIYEGGPVEGHRGFVLHSNDFFISSTVPVGPKLGMTTTLDVLRHISTGTGPARALIAMGYSGWGAGQLEQEIAENGWLVCPADAELLFSAPADERYTLALASIGVDRNLLSSQVGHA